jgi:hypothetical protein
MKLFVPLAAVAVVAGWFGGPLVRGAVHPSSTPRQVPRRITTAIGPLALSYVQLRNEARVFGGPIFWAGPGRGYRYELTRTTSDHFYVRYLPPGVRAGAPSAKFVVVATYHFPGAYKSLKRVAKGKAVRGPGGSLIFTRPDNPKSVLLAYPGYPYEVEVYAPSPAVAAAVARSGRVQPVR